MTSPQTLCPSSAAAPDGASQVDGDTEEGEEFDFDSDDSGADTSHQAAETSHVVDRKQPGSDVQETTAADVSGATGSRASGKHSLYHRCSYQAGSEVRESPEGCSISSDLTTIAEADSSWRANSSYEAQTSSRARGWLSVVSELTLRLSEAKPAVKPEGLQEELSRAAVEAPGLQEAPQQELQEASSGRPPAGDHVTAGDAEVLYDDVPAETGARTLDGDHTEDVEDIYEDVQPVHEQRSNGWSSNEFESFDDLSDDDAAPPTCRNHQLYNKVLKVKDFDSVAGGKLPPSSRPPTGGGFFTQGSDNKVQQLIRAAKTNTRDGLERTRTAMIRKVSFLHRKVSTVEEQDDDAGYMDVSVSELKHPPAQLCPMPEGLSSQQVVRRLILSSIVQSEISYLDSLKRILQEYQRPLLEQSSILNHKKVRQIFYRVQEIHQCHTMFQIALASRVSEWDQSQMIGDLFVASFSKSMVLNVYSDYINNFTNAMALIKKGCLSKPLFLDFLKKKQASSADRITLYGLMVKPIQRFPQFILLLQDMLKNTPKSHADRLPLQLALTELETLADKLNKQKHLADQEAEIQLITHSAGGRSLNKLLNWDQQLFIHCELLVETVYGDKGQVLKSKERKLFLLNDSLICANVNLKGPPDVGSLVPLGPKYTVKWCHPLVQTEVVEAGRDTADSRDSVRGHGSSSSCTGNLFLGPPRLYQELEELQHDLGVVEQVSHMVATLQGTYQNLNSTVSQDWCLALQRLLRLKEEELQNANKCRLSLSIPGKPDRSGHPVNIMVVFNTPSPLSKISWVNRLHLAKIAQRPENIMGWKCAEEEDQKKKAPFTCPLLTCKLPVLASKTQSLKLAAALHSPSQSSPIGFCSVSTSLPQGYLWVAGGGGDSGQGQVEIFSLHRNVPRLVKTVSVNAPVLCLEYVKEPSVSAEEREVAGLQSSAKTGNIICVGLQDGSVLVYSSMDTTVQCLLTFVTPDSRPVLCIKHTQMFLLAGLANGTVALYQREAGDTLWDVDSCTLVSLGSEPVANMLTVEDTVWATCANEVTVIQEPSLHKQSFTAHSDPSCAVSHMVQSGGGVWMAFSRSSSIHLFHTETLEQLQEVNISPRATSVTTGQLLVSSMLICKGQLWVGTSQGLVLCFPVPTLEGIPKVTGKGKTSMNAHCGPVDFLVSVSGTLALNLLKEDSTLNGCSDSKGDVELGESHRKLKQGLQQPEGCAPAEEKPVHLLQYRLCSTHHLPGKLLSAQPEHPEPAAPASSPEHRPEDGSIYEVSEDPDVWVRGHASKGGKDCEARRNKVTSTAVFSGGRGHRRVGEVDAQSEHNSGDNTLLVWQLPLTFSQ